MTDLKITAVRVRKLMSGPGYNHHAVEAEARVDDGDDAAEVRERLTAWVDGELRGHREIEELSAHRDMLRSDVVRLEDQRDALRKDIAKGTKIIAEHDKLRGMAEAAGLGDVVRELGDPMPF